MTVTYKTIFNNLTVPVLHRVVYENVEDYVAAPYQHSLLDRRVNAWLKENCQHPYYHSPGYTREKFIEFEDDQEAVLFALRWA